VLLHEVGCGEVANVQFAMTGRGGGGRNARRKLRSKENLARRKRLLHGKMGDINEKGERADDVNRGTEKVKEMRGGGGISWEENFLRGSTPALRNRKGGL